MVEQERHLRPSATSHSQQHRRRDGKRAEGAAEGLSAGKLVIDMSSISPIATKDFAQHLDRLGYDGWVGC